MAYEAKTNWKLDDTVMPNDMNRIEQGIKDVELELGNVNGIVVLEASTDNVIDFNTLVDSGLYLIKNCVQGSTALNTPITNSGTNVDVYLKVVTTYSQGAVAYIYQHATISGSRLPYTREYRASAESWYAWGYAVPASSISAGTLAGQVKANASAVTTLTNSQVRNIKAQTTDLTAGTSTLATGDIVFVYE